LASEPVWTGAENLAPFNRSTTSKTTATASWPPTSR